MAGTVNQGIAVPQSAAGWPVQPYGMADTLFVSASIANPPAGSAIVSLTPPAGTYRIDLYGFLAAANTDGSAGPDMEFRKGGVVQFGVFGGYGDISGAVAASPNGQCGHADFANNIRMTLDGATSISINATGAISTTTVFYVARIIATRIF